MPTLRTPDPVRVERSRDTWLPDGVSRLRSKQMVMVKIEGANMADQKAIFISGGASGIGRAAAVLFAAKGWRVGIGDVDASGMAATAEALDVETHALDVRDFDQWVAVLDAFTRGGPLHVLHNN